MKANPHEGGAMSARPPLIRFRHVAVVSAALALAGVVVAAAAASGSSASGTKAARGGTITVLSAGDVDHIDPGQAYYSFSYEITYATQRPLLSYKPDSVTPI